MVAAVHQRVTRIPIRDTKWAQDFEVGTVANSARRRRRTSNEPGPLGRAISLAGYHAVASALQHMTSAASLRSWLTEREQRGENSQRYAFPPSSRQSSTNLSDEFGLGPINVSRFFSFFLAFLLSLSIFGWRVPNRAIPKYYIWLKRRRTLNTSLHVP